MNVTVYNTVLICAMGSLMYTVDLYREQLSMWL